MKLHKLKSFDIVVIVIMLILGIIVIPQIEEQSSSIQSYEDCVQAGYPVLQSYPLICRTDEGRDFPKRIDACDKIADSPELSFGMHYCMGAACETICDENGENCRRVTTESECESIDVVSEENIEVASIDGIPDCMWVDDRCIPNK